MRDLSAYFSYFKICLLLFFAGVLPIAICSLGVQASRENITLENCMPAQATTFPSGDYIGADAGIYDQQHEQCYHLDSRFWRQKFVAWALDGKYAVFRSSDQYGNSTTTIFETATRKYQSYPLACAGSTSADCHGGVVTLTDNRLFLNNGYLVRVEDLALVADYSQSFPPDHIVVAGMFSPDQKTLVFVTTPIQGQSVSQAPDQASHVYLADGNTVTLLGALQEKVLSYEVSIEWLPGEYQVQITTRQENYVFPRLD